MVFSYIFSPGASLEGGRGKGEGYKNGRYKMGGRSKTRRKHSFETQK